MYFSSVAGSSGRTSAWCVSKVAILVLEHASSFLRNEIFLMHYLAILSTKFNLQLNKFYLQIWYSHFLSFLLVPHRLLLVLLSNLVSQIPVGSPIFPALPKYEDSKAISVTKLICAWYD